MRACSTILAVVIGISAGTSAVQAISRAQMQDAQRDFDNFWAASPETGSFEAALRVTGLYDQLATADTAMTVFSPTDLAFDIFSASNMMTTMDLLNHPQLSWLMQYHVVPSFISADQYNEGAVLEALNGESMSLFPSLYLGNSRLTMLNGADPLDEGVAVLLGESHQIGSVIIQLIDLVLVPAASHLGSDPSIVRYDLKIAGRLFGS